MWSQLSTRPGPGVPCDGEIERQFQGEDHRGFVLNTRNRESGQGLEYRSSVTLCGPHSQSALSTVSSQLPAGVAEPEEQLELPKAGVCAHTCAVCVYVHVRVCVCVYFCAWVLHVWVHAFRLISLGSLYWVSYGASPRAAALLGLPCKAGPAASTRCIAAKAGAQVMERHAQSPTVGGSSTQMRPQATPTPEALGQPCWNASSIARGSGAPGTMSLPA